MKLCFRTLLPGLLLAGGCTAKEEAEQCGFYPPYGTPQPGKNLLERRDPAADARALFATDRFGVVTVLDARGELETPMSRSDEEFFRSDRKWREMVFIDTHLGHWRGVGAVPSPLAGAACRDPLATDYARRFNAEMIALQRKQSASRNASNAPDPILAEHPVVGRSYVEAFESDARIPTPFRGEWSSDPATCGTDTDDGDSRIWVDAITVGFQGETHVATGAADSGPQMIRLTYAPPVADYHYRIAPPQLRLSADGKTLEGLDERGNPGHGKWQRCPSGG